MGVGETANLLMIAVVLTTCYDTLCCTVLIPAPVLRIKHVSLLQSSHVTPVELVQISTRRSVQYMPVALISFPQAAFIICRRAQSPLVASAWTHGFPTGLIAHLERVAAPLYGRMSTSLSRLSLTRALSRHDERLFNPVSAQVLTPQASSSAVISVMDPSQRTKALRNP